MCCGLSKEGGSGEQFEGGQFGESIQRGWSQTLEGPNEKESHCCVLTKG